MYPRYYTNIARAMRGEEELAVKPEQARDVIRLIELADESNAEKRSIPVS
jgi:predicted dehydrogenase